MKTVGLIGGMSWESTVLYYQIINTVIKEQLGGLHSAKCVIYSVDFHDIEAFQAAGDWDKSAQVLIKAARSLEKAGAHCVVICTNTMHKVADAVQHAVSIPLLHIADITADTLQRQNVNRVGLLGTKYTMEQDFYKAKLIARDLEVFIPNAEDRSTVNATIYNELCLGTVSDCSREHFLRIIDQLAQQGAQGVILGCTEIGMLIQQKDTPIPLFDTTRIHAEQAALYAIA